MKMKLPQFLTRLMFPKDKTPAVADANVTVSRASPVGRVRAKVIAALAIDPQTSYEIALSIGEHVHNVVARVSELKAVGLVVDTGRKGLSQTPNRGAAIWALAA